MKFEKFILIFKRLDFIESINQQKKQDLERKDFLPKVKSDLRVIDDRFHAKSKDIEETLATADGEWPINGKTLAID